MSEKAMAMLFILSLFFQFFYPRATTLTACVCSPVIYCRRQVALQSTANNEKMLLAICSETPASPYKYIFRWTQKKVCARPLSPISEILKEDLKVRLSSVGPVIIQSCKINTLRFLPNSLLSLRVGVGWGWLGQSRKWQLRRHNISIRQQTWQQKKGDEDHFILTIIWLHRVIEFFFL